MVGREAKSGGIAKAEVKMVMDLACAQVPNVRVVVGSSYKARKYCMCEPAFIPSSLSCNGEQASCKDASMNGKREMGTGGSKGELTACVGESKGNRERVKSVSIG